MDLGYEEGVLSILQGREGWSAKFNSISEFKQELEEADLAQKIKFEGDWILWRENERQFEQQRIITLLHNFASGYWFGNLYMQYWGAERVEGKNHYLSSSNYPFLVGSGLINGQCWYRKLCRDHVYVVDVGNEDQELDGLGGVGRAYRNKQPESTPDLRLYSTNEFPMRDEAARCGFRYYMALPLFLPHKNQQCCGVLELLSDKTIISKNLLSTMETTVQVAGFTSTHNTISISRGFHMQPAEREIEDMLELVMTTVPRLHLAQVWGACKQKQCLNMINNPNSHCMEITTSISYRDKIVNSHDGYLGACEFHNQQIDLSCLDLGIGDDLSISKNPLAHYAHKSRLSHSFAVSLQHVYHTNQLFVIQFFHQPNFRKDGGLLHLLLRMVEMNLKGFKFVSEGGVRSSELPQEPNAIDCELTGSLDVIKSYKQKLSLSNFTTYLEMDDPCSPQHSPERIVARDGFSTSRLTH